MNDESIANDEYAISDYFFGTFYISGVLIIWPLLAWLLLQRANKSQVIGYREGCRMSIKIYIGLIIYHFAKPRKNQARENIKRAFPKLKSSEIEKILKNAYVNFCHNF